jgi:hypothetical protein
MYVRTGFTGGRVREVRFGVSEQVEVYIACPEQAILRPGQYLLATDAQAGDAPLSTPVFMVEKSPHGFWAVPVDGVKWNPGTNLLLAGPLGHGFELTRGLQRLGLVALGETVSRLLPLIYLASEMQATTALFTGLGLPRLPAAVEVHPLASLLEALDWPDFIAIDVSLGRLGEVRRIFDLSLSTILPCPVQVLVTTAFPCARLGQCGACAIRSRRGWKLACEDGPVFNLSSIYW